MNFYEKHTGKQTNREGYISVEEILKASNEGTNYFFLSGQVISACSLRNLYKIDKSNVK